MAGRDTGARGGRGTFPCATYSMKRNPIHVTCVYYMQLYGSIIVYGWWYLIACRTSDAALKRLRSAAHHTPTPHRPPLDPTRLGLGAATCQVQRSGPAQGQGPGRANTHTAVYMQHVHVHELSQKTERTKSLSVCSVCLSGSVIIIRPLESCYGIESSSKSTFTIERSALHHRKRPRCVIRGRSDQTGVSFSRSRFAHVQKNSRHSSPSSQLLMAWRSQGMPRVSPPSGPR